MTDNEDINSDDEINYFEKKKEYDDIIRKVFDDHIEAAVKQSAELIKNKERYRAGKRLCSALLSKVSNEFKLTLNNCLSESGIISLNIKYFSSLQDLINDVKKEKLDLDKQIIIHILSQKKYVYFSNKDKCLEFLKFLEKYKPECLTEVVPANGPQNLSIIVPVIEGQNNDMRGEFIKKIKSIFAETYKDIKVVIQKDEVNNVFWAHFTGICFENYSEMVDKTLKLIGEYSKMFLYPPKTLVHGTTIEVYEKPIRGDKCSESFEKLGQLSSNDIIELLKTSNIRDIYITVNNIGGNLNNVGGNMYGGNANIINRPPEEEWIDKNPPQENESTGNYYARYKLANPNGITSQKFTKKVKCVGFKKYRKKGNTFRVWIK